MTDDFNKQFGQQCIETLQSIKVLTGNNIKLKASDVTATEMTLLQLMQKVMFDDSLVGIRKDCRPFISQSSKFVRARQELKHYAYWSGFQAIDIDFKQSEASKLAKPILHKMLVRYPWYAGIALSTSGNGLHIYTINKPMDAPQDAFGVFMSNDVLQKMKQNYMDAYELKSYIIWKMLVMVYDELIAVGLDEEIAKQVHPIYNTTTRQIGRQGKLSNAQVLDPSMCKISQVLLITHDADMFVNANCKLLECAEFDVHMYAGSDERFKVDVLKQQFDRIRGRFDMKRQSHMKSVIGTDQEFTDRGDITVEQWGNLATCTPQNYDNVGRYRMAYTLAWLYDLQTTNSVQYDEVCEMFLQMCSGNPKYNAERNAWAKTFASAVERNKNGSAPCVWSAIKELREHHGFKFRFKNRQSVVVSELVKEHNSEEQIRDFILSKLPTQDDFDLHYDNVIELQHGEYLSTYKNRLESIFKTGLNFLVARPGSGKTEFFKQLMNDGKRVLLVEPYTSILSSKIETSDLNVHCIYGSRPLDLAKHVNCAITFDKFSIADPEEMSILYDYIAIDESHLLTISSYRDIVPADVIDKLQHLHTKVILMTGTPIAEHMFCKFETVTQCHKALDFNKDVRFVCCKHEGDKLGKLATHIAAAIKQGKKVLFPTNRGDMFVHSVMGSVRMHLGRSPKFKYYKKDNQLHDFVQAINEQGTLGDIEVMFCTNFLSVGIDINDTCEFDVIYDETFSGPEIEQFNSRLRKIAIQSYVYFSMVNSKGEPKNITAYDELDLSVSKIESLTFWDMLQMQTKRNDSRSMYDFFERAFNSPWFYKDQFTGEIKIHCTAYKLAMFEEKWRKWAEQLNVIQNTLTSYGYECKVVQDVVIDDLIIQQSLQAAKEARAEYRQEKNSKIGRMFASFNNQATFESILNVPADNIVDGDEWKLAKRRRRGELVYQVEDRKIFDTWRGSLKLLSKFYKFDTIMQIIDEYVIDDKELYRLSRLHSLRDAVSIFDAGTNGQMDVSNIKIVSYITNDIFSGSQDVVQLDNSVVDLIMHNCAVMYFDAKGYQPQSPEVLNNVEWVARRLFKAITIKQNNIYALKTLPKFDSGYSRTRNTLATMLSALFSNTSIFADNTERLKEQVALQHSLNKLVFDEDESDKPMQEMFASTDIVSFKRVNADKSKIDWTALPEIDMPDRYANADARQQQQSTEPTSLQSAIEKDMLTMQLEEEADKLL